MKTNIVRAAALARQRLQQVQLGFLRNWLNNRWMRRVVLWHVVWGWMQVLNLVIVSGDIFTGLWLLVAYFLVCNTACIMYRATLDEGSPHKHFWWRFLLMLGASILLCKLLGATTGLFITVVVTFLIGKPHARPAEISIPDENGREGIAPRTAAVEYYRSNGRGEPTFPLGDVNIPLKYASTHIALVGTTGSGKTVTLKLLMEDLLPGIGLTPQSHRAVIYDPKREFYSYLEALGIPEDSILVMNPFDRRCRPWDMAADIRTPTDAENLAGILVPDKGEKDQFWRSATLISIKAVVRYLNYKSPRTWRFRDLLLALRDRIVIMQMIQDEPRLHHYAQTYGSDNTAANIMSTVLTKVERYEPIAALWHKAETVYGSQPVSLTAWVNQSSILLLGRDAAAQTQMQELNRVILTRVMQLISNKSETRIPDTFFILDEFGSLGEMSSIITLATEGRSKGASLIAGFQSDAQLVKNYGKEGAREIWGQFGHIAVMRLRDAETESWIAGLLGETEVIRYTMGQSDGGFMRGITVNVNEQYAIKKLLMPGVLTGIPQFDPTKGVHLKGFIAGTKNWWFSYPPNILNKITPPINEAENFLPMPDEYQELDMWADADCTRLHSEHLKPVQFPTQNNNGKGHKHEFAEQEARFQRILEEEEI